MAVDSVAAGAAATKSNWAKLSASEAVHQEVEQGTSMVRWQTVL